MSVEYTFCRSWYTFRPMMLRLSAGKCAFSAYSRAISARAAVSSAARWLLISMSVGAGCQSGRSS